MMTAVIYRCSSDVCTIRLQVQIYKKKSKQKLWEILDDSYIVVVVYNFSFDSNTIEIRDGGSTLSESIPVSVAAGKKKQYSRTTQLWIRYMFHSTKIQTQGFAFKLSYKTYGAFLFRILHPWLVPSSGVAGIADDGIPPCCPVCCLVFFQTHFCHVSYKHLSNLGLPALFFFSLACPNLAFLSLCHYVLLASHGRTTVSSYLFHSLLLHSSLVSDDRWHCKLSYMKL